MQRVYCLTALILGSAFSGLHAQVPQLINYQGRVVSGGTNFNGTGQFRYALVNAGGSVTFWSNDGTSAGGSQPTAAVSLGVSNGLYAVLLGNTDLPNMTAVPNTVFTNSDVRLRVWFNDGVSGSQLLAPDQRIAAVGYAMMAASIPDGSVTSNKLLDGAVIPSKLADGAITAAKLGSNSVTSLQMSNSIALGTFNSVNGLLNVYRTAAGTPAISLDGSTSTISTFGSDGLEQIRLWGVSYGEILLHDSTGNDTTVTLSANANNGGSLTLSHSNSAPRAYLSASATSGDLRLYSTNGFTRSQLHGGADGSYLNLYAADGTSGLYLDGEDGGGGSIGVRNTNGSNRVYIDGQGLSGGGQVTVYTGSGGYGANLYGDSGGAGLLYLYNTNSSMRAYMDGLGTGGGGEIALYANDGSSSLKLYGNSSSGGGGEVSVMNSSSTEVAELVGNTYGGSLTLRDEAGGHTVVISSSGTTGGYGYWYQGDGQLGVSVDGDYGGAGYISVYGTNGTAKITLNGNSSGDGRITCDVLQINGGADLSEQFDINAGTDEIKPGMIVSIDTKNPGELVLSTKAFDRTVAGVVSGAGGVKSGMLMGQTGTKAAGKHPVALTGRVYCYVDADAGGSVAPGDLITPSSSPGHGMKVTDHVQAQGAIIGKAMSSLTSGKGLVLVLVSLQ
jgi:hypothetical protein